MSDRPARWWYDRWSVTMVLLCILDTVLSGVSIALGVGWWDLALGVVVVAILTLAVTDTALFRGLRDVWRIYRAHR